MPYYLFCSQPTHTRKKYDYYGKYHEDINNLIVCHALNHLVRTKKIWLSKLLHLSLTGIQNMHMTDRTERRKSFLTQKNSIHN